MNYFHAYIYKYKKRNKTYLEPKKKKRKKTEPTNYTEENPIRALAPVVNNSEVGHRWGIVSHAASSSPSMSVLIAKLGDREEASLSKCELSRRPAAAEFFPPFPGKTPESVQGLESLEQGPWSHTSDSTQADLVSAGQAGWSWPQALFWKLSISLPEVPLLYRPPLLFSFLTSAWGEIETAGMGDTSSSLAGGSLATPAECPAEPHSHRATHKAMGPTPSHQPSPETADGAENMASGTAAGTLAAWRGVYIDLNPGTPGEGWLAGSGCPGQPILAPQVLIVAENGPC